MTIRILIVDDQPAVRSCLQAAMSVFDDIEVVGEAANGEAAVRLSETLQPDVVLMDLLMPQMNGVTATRLIRQRYPHVQVLVLTSFPENYLVQSALNAGAISYLLKNISAEELADAVHDAYYGKSRFASEALASLKKELPLPITTPLNNLYPFQPVPTLVA